MSTWNGAPNLSAKGGGNTGGIYNSTYTSGADQKNHMKDKGKKPTLMVYKGKISKTTTLFLPPEE